MASATDGSASSDPAGDGTFKFVIYDRVRKHEHEFNCTPKTLVQPMFDDYHKIHAVSPTRQEVQFWHSGNKLVYNKHTTAGDLGLTHGTLVEARMFLVLKLTCEDNGFELPIRFSANTKLSNVFDCYCQRRGNLDRQYVSFWHENTRWLDGSETASTAGLQSEEVVAVEESMIGVVFRTEEGEKPVFGAHTDSSLGSLFKRFCEWYQTERRHVSFSLGHQLLDLYGEDESITVMDAGLYDGAEVKVTLSKEIRHMFLKVLHAQSWLLEFSIRGRDTGQGV